MRFPQNDFSKKPEAHEPIAHMWMETAGSSRSYRPFSIAGFRAFLWKCIFWMWVIGAGAIYYGKLAGTEMSFHDAVNSDVHAVVDKLISLKADFDRVVLKEVPPKAGPVLPVTSGYTGDFKQEVMDGTESFRLINSTGLTLLVKMFALDGVSETEIREFHLVEGDSIRLSRLDAGRYLFRYKRMELGDFVKTDIVSVGTRGRVSTGLSLTPDTGNSIGPSEFGSPW